MIEDRQQRVEAFKRLPQEVQEQLVDAHEDFMVALFPESQAEIVAAFRLVRGRPRRPAHGPAGVLGVVARRKAAADRRADADEMTA